MEPEFRKDKFTFLKARTRIDLDNIDDAVSEMPELIRECGECVSLAIEIREALKLEVDQTRAMAAETLRSSTGANGKPLSESAIESKVPLDKEYNSKLLEFAEARRDAALWTSLMEALRTKSANLRAAADLICSGYITQDYIKTKYRQQIRDAKKV